MKAECIIHLPFFFHAHQTDPLEPEHVAQAITEWGLDYVVLTR